MRPSVMVCAVLLGLPVAGARATRPERWGAGDSALVSLRAEELARARTSLRNGDSTLRPALTRLLSDAEHALTAGPFSVMDKKRVPPSGNRHDYVSIGPYWWPDSTKPNGLPYIRRDGQRNPETLDDYDAPRLKKLMDAVNTLALAYYFTEREPYASRAVELLRAWFVDTATRMNPSLTYGQAIPGITDGRGIGIIETRGIVRLLDAVAMLDEAPSFMPADRRALSQWFSDYLDWLLTSRNGRDELAAKNNHGSWYDAQTAALALFLGKPDLTRRIIAASETRRVATQIKADGSQPLEEARTRSFEYSVMNLEGLIQLAELGRKVGVDLWHYQPPAAGGIRKAIDYLAPYADTTKKWHGQQITAVDATRLLEVLRMSELVFQDARYTALIARMPRDRIAQHRIQLLVPPFRRAPRV